MSLWFWDGGRLWSGRSRGGEETVSEHQGPERTGPGSCSWPCCPLSLEAALPHPLCAGRAATQPLPGRLRCLTPDSTARLASRLDCPGEHHPGPGPFGGAAHPGLGADARPSRPAVATPASQARGVGRVWGVANAAEKAAAAAQLVVTPHPGLSPRAQGGRGGRWPPFRGSSEMQRILTNEEAAASKTCPASLARDQPPGRGGSALSLQCVGPTPAGTC